MKLIDSTGIKRFVSKILEVIGSKVASGEWLPVRKGDGNGSVVEGGKEAKATGKYSHAEGNGTTASGILSHAEGYGTTASGGWCHAEGNRTIASGEYSHAEGYSTTASGRWSHAEGANTEATSWCSHAEGGETKALGLSSHAEGNKTIASGTYSHAQGCCNYDDASFIDMVGVGRDYSGHPRKNAVAVYVGRYSDGGDINPTDPKNGYQYLLNVGGYKGQAVENGMKSVQEVFADHDSRITLLEHVKKSKPQKEYVVGRAMKCSLLTYSSYDRVRYIVPCNLKTVSLLVGNKYYSLLAAKGDSIKVKFVDINDNVIPLTKGAASRSRLNSSDITISIDASKVITISSTTDKLLYRIPLDIFLPFKGAWYVSNVVDGDDDIYVITLSKENIPSSFDTASPYRKFENGIVVNKRLPKSLGFVDSRLVDTASDSQNIIVYKYTKRTTKWLESLGKRIKKKKIIRKNVTAGICNITVKHGSEKKSCYMQTWVVSKVKDKKKRLH